MALALGGGCFCWVSTVSFFPLAHRVSWAARPDVRQDHPELTHCL